MVDQKYKKEIADLFGKYADVHGRYSYFQQRFEDKEDLTAEYIRLMISAQVKQVESYLKDIETAAYRAPKAKVVEDLKKWGLYDQEKEARENLVRQLRAGMDVLTQLMEIEAEAASEGTFSIRQK